MPLPDLPSDPPDPDSLEIQDLIVEMQTLREGRIGPADYGRRYMLLAIRLYQLGFNAAELQAWLTRPPGERGDDGLDDLEAALVRNRSPRGPLGKLGGSVHPPEVDTPEDGPCA